MYYRNIRLLSWSAAIIVLIVPLTVSSQAANTILPIVQDQKNNKIAEVNKRKIRMKMSTSVGNIVLELFEEKAPKTVENFKRYVQNGHYDGTIFHRVIKGFMIQGGGFESGLIQKSADDPIENEADNGLKNQIGTIAMARTNDPHSATAQFFINVADNEFLDHKAKSSQGWGYAVFGKVVEGMDVVRKIEMVATEQKGPHGDVPETDVVIIKVEEQN